MLHLQSRNLLEGENKVMNLLVNELILPNIQLLNVVIVNTKFRMHQDYLFPSLRYSPSSVEAGSRQPAKKSKAMKVNQRTRQENHKNRSY